jgi:class 3 adenylate cyclase
MADLLRGICTDDIDCICSGPSYASQVNSSRDQARELPVVATVNRPWPPCIPLHRAIVAVDIAGSTTRTNPAKARLRQLIYNLLNHALRASGILKRHHDPLIDRGDGALILIHPSDQVPKTLLLHSFIPALHKLLTDHNTHHPDNAFQLRIAAHSGEVHYDQWGPFGEAVDITCRLLDAPELKATLATTKAPTALVVSDDVYRTIIRHRYNGTYEQFQSNVKIEIADITYIGWIRQPRLSATQHVDTIISAGNLFSTPPGAFLRPVSG